MTLQAVPPAFQADWTSALPKGQRTSEAVALVLSALTVLSIVAGAFALARWLDVSAGQLVGVDEAMLIDLPPPPPAATAASEAAPDAPAVEAPDLIEPADAPDASPDHPAQLAPPVPFALPEALKQVQAPDASIASDVALPPSPPPAPAAKPEPKPDAKPKPPKTAVKSVASTKTAARSDAAGQGETSVNRGQAADLKAAWGASIRKRVERRKSYPSAAGKAAGTTTVRLVVTRGGTLTSLSIAGSSGNAVLDDAAIRAVRSAGSFPSAPAELQDAFYVFTLPISFAR